MDLEFETLDCGHAANQYVGFGICVRCHKKFCSKCLQLTEQELLCPDCFCKFVNRGDCCG